MRAVRQLVALVTATTPKSVLFVPARQRRRGDRRRSRSQNVDREHAFSESDQQLLETLAGSLSVALENARLVHETRQRNAELALINSVQEALAGELEMQAIYDVVGDKIQEIFDAQVVDIGIFDFAAGLTSYPYTIERGVRFPEESGPITSHPTTRQLLETKAAVLVRDAPARDRELGTVSPVAEGTERPLSMLFVPLVSGDEVRGRISLQNLDRTNAFTESDVRLLTTLAGSLSVALENARLVHETRQRNAELALINSVQEALAGELDDAGDLRRRRRQDSGGLRRAGRRHHDRTTRATGLIHFPYTSSAASGCTTEPIELVGFRKHVIETGEPLLIDENMEAEAERYGNPTVSPARCRSRRSSCRWSAAGRRRACISLQNVDREHAFTESDQQLLETLAGSLSVALENARLVHETRQRNAELALINSVQEALAGELEMQAIYDIVGDKIQEIFDAQVVDIAIFDFAAGLTRFPYAIERGVRFPDEPMPLERSLTTKEILATKAAVVSNDVDAWFAERGAEQSVPQGEPARSMLLAPLGSGDEIRGRISLQNLDRTNAFSENDVRLLTTLAGSLSVALENARLVHETRQRNAELALINSVQDAIAGRARPAGDLRRRRRQDSGGVRGASRLDLGARRDDRVAALPLHDRTGRAAGSAADHAARLLDPGARDARADSDRREPRGRVQAHRQQS